MSCSGATFLTAEPPVLGCHNSMVKEMENSPLFRKMSKLCEDTSNVAPVNSEANPVRTDIDSLLEDIESIDPFKYRSSPPPKLWKEFGNTEVDGLQVQESEKISDAFSESPRTNENNEPVTESSTGVQIKEQPSDEGTYGNSVESLEYLQRIHVNCMTTMSSDTFTEDKITTLPGAVNLEAPCNEPTGAQSEENEEINIVDSNVATVANKEPETMDYETVTQFVTPLLQKRTIDVLQEELRKRETILNSKENGDSVMVVLIKIPKKKLSLGSSQTLSTLDCLDSFSAISSQECAKFRKRSLSFKDSWDSISVPDPRSPTGSHTSSNEGGIFRKTDDYVTKLVTIIAKLECIPECEVRNDAESNSNVHEYLEKRLSKVLKENESILLAATNLLERADKLEKDNKRLKEKLSCTTSSTPQSGNTMEETFLDTTFKQKPKTADNMVTEYDQEDLTLPPGLANSYNALSNTNFEKTGVGSSESTSNRSNSSDKAIQTTVVEKQKESNKISAEKVEDLKDQPFIINQIQQDFLAHKMSYSHPRIEDIQSDTINKVTGSSPSGLNASFVGVAPEGNTTTGNSETPFQSLSQTASNDDKANLYDSSVTNDSENHKPFNDSKKRSNESGSTCTYNAELTEHRVATNAGKYHDNQLSYSKPREEEQHQTQSQKSKKISQKVLDLFDTDIKSKKTNAKRRRYLGSKSAEILQDRVEAMRLQHYQDYQLPMNSMERRPSALLGADFIQKLAQLDEVITSLKWKVVKLEEEKLDLTKEMVDQVNTVNSLKRENLGKMKDDGVNAGQNFKNSSGFWQKRGSFQAELLMRTYSTRMRIEREDSINRVSAVNEDVMRTVESAMSFF